jgi:hypothetical protein
MRKEVGWQCYQSIGLHSNYYRCDFHTNLCKPHSVSGLKLKPWFCHLQSIIVSQHRMKNCWRYLNGFCTIVKPPLGICLLFGVFLQVLCRSLQWRKSNYSHATNVGKVPLPKLQTSHRFVALFEMIYYGSPIFTVISNIGEDVQLYNCTMFQLIVWCEKFVAARHYAVICKQLLIWNYKNRTR